MLQISWSPRLELNGAKRFVTIAVTKTFCSLLRTNAGATEYVCIRTNNITALTLSKLLYDHDSVD